MPLSKTKLSTIDDIYALPDGQRAELIDGTLYNMSPPNRLHQRIVFFLARKIADYIDSQNGDCEVNISPFAVFLNENDTTYVEPDISVVCDKNKLNEHGCNGAPDWIIEIVSSSSKRMDYFIKLFKYRTAGVREYWIVDPIKNLVTTYNFQNETTEIYTFVDKIRSGIYENLEIDFSFICN